MDGPVIDALVDAAYVNLSLDAATAGTYARLKFRDHRAGRVKFDRAVANLTALAQRRRASGTALEINVSFILYPGNYHPRPGGASYGSAIEASFAQVWEGEQRRRIRATPPGICPKVCDPFKQRANTMLFGGPNSSSPPTAWITSNVTSLVCSTLAPTTPPTGTRPTDARPPGWLAG